MEKLIYPRKGLSQPQKPELQGQQHLQWSCSGSSPLYTCNIYLFVDAPCALAQQRTVRMRNLLLRTARKLRSLNYIKKWLSSIVVRTKVEQCSCYLHALFAFVNIRQRTRWATQHTSTNIKYKSIQQQILNKKLH